MLRVYSYSGCDSCRKAIKLLRGRGAEFENKAIRDTPPTQGDLETMLGYYDGNLRKLFNVSGQDYRAMNLKEKLPSMNDRDAIELLSSNGNLIKRPFVLGEGAGVVGFKLEEWEERLGL